MAQPMFRAFSGTKPDHPGDGLACWSSATPCTMFLSSFTLMTLDDSTSSTTAVATAAPMVCTPVQVALHLVPEVIRTWPYGDGRFVLHRIVAKKIYAENACNLADARKLLPVVVAVTCILGIRLLRETGLPALVFSNSLANLNTTSRLLLLDGCRGTLQRHRGFSADELT